MGGGGGGGSNNSSGSGGGGGHEGGNGGNSNVNDNKPKSFNSGTLITSSDGVTGDPSGPITGSVTILCLASLPVELINFKALIRDNQTVDLLWSTASEKNNLGYDVERSADNQNWKTLGFVPGNGTTTEHHEYVFTDEKPFSGVNYYRLKQQDYDGKSAYSPIVVADVRMNGLDFDIFPNPSTGGALNVRTVSKVEGEALLEIYDWVGYKVYKETVQLLKGTMVYPVSMATFPKGSYTARLELPDGNVLFRKIVLQ